MKNYYKNFKRALHVLPTLLFLFLGAGLFAQTSVWTGDVDTDWSNSANWSGGVPTTGFTAIVPGAPQGGNFPVYEGSYLIDYTIQNGGTLTFNTVIYNIGVIINFEGGMVNSNELFINAGSITFDNDGEFKSYNNLENYGIIDNAASGALKILSGAFNNYGAVTNFGNVSNVSGTSINNYGTIESVATLTINGSFDNYGVLNSAVGSTLILNGSGYLTNHNNGYFECTCNLTNSAIITNNGKMQVNFSSNFDNDNTLLNNGTLGLSGDLVNGGTFENNSTINILDAGVLTNNTTLTNNGNIDLTICGSIVQNGTGDIGGTILSDGLIYEINGTINDTNIEFSETFSSLTQKKDPIAGCKPNVFVQLPESGAITIPTTTIDKGSYGSCGAQLTNVTVTPSSFSSVDIGQQVVTLDIEDEFGFTSSCDAIITVLEYQEPITAIDNPNIDGTCPQDISITALPGDVSASATWIEPVATTTCAPTETGNPDCTQVPNDLGGLIYMGEYNNSKYYCSNTNDFTWHNAKAAAESLGGHLAIVNDAAENEFIRNGIIADYAWVGLTDENSEGTFKTVFGDNAPYLNWSAGEPNNNGGNEHYVRLLKSSGKWTDRTATFHAEYVMEVPCPVAESVAGLQTCALKNFGLSNNGIGERLVWINFDHLSVNREYAVSNEGSSFTEFADGTAQLTGTIQQVDNHNNKWIYSVNLINRRTWSEWSALGRDYKANINVPADHTQWSYYELDNNTSVFEGAGDNIGKILYINHGPASYNYGFQVGDGANTFNGHYGISGWFDFYGDFSGSGDFNGNLDSCVPNGGTGGGNSDVVTIEQIQGLPAGSEFPIGTSVIAYKYTDDCGNEEICTFDVTIEAVPTNLEVTCVENIVVDALPGAGSSIVSWVEPTASTDCFINEAFVNRTDDGPANGEAFPIGTTFINYAAIDSCFNFEGCVFSVTVNEVPAVLELTNCPSDINSSEEIVTWDLPTATSNCFEAGVTITQIDGPAPGSAFPDGATQVVYLITDECGNTLPCDFYVNVTLCSPAGTACDDGDACTTNDQEDGDCNCTGTFADSDNDGVCDAEDICAGSDDAADEDGDGIPNGCDPCNGNLEGTACNDNDACTTGDVYDANCNCAGTFADADNDGICDAEDICEGSDDTADADGDGTPDGCDDCDAALEGTTCDDLDACTTGDVYDANCNCAGTFADADNDGVCDAEDICEGSDDAADADGDGTPDGCDDCDAALAGTACDDLDACTTGDVYDANCNCAGTFADADNDGVCDAEDICAGSDDTADADGDGTPDGCDDCDAALEGTACDDLDACTTGDVYDANCNCAGTFVDADGDGVCAAEDCDDNNESLPATPGTVCDDGDAATNDDVILEDGCTCLGSLPNIDGGEITTNDPTEICAGDGIGDPIDVALTGEVGANSAWVITDAALNILGLPAGPPFDLEGAGEGVCLIWHLSFEAGLTGAEVGLNAADLNGVYDLSNAITVTRNGVDGGEITTNDPTEICAGDGVGDPIDVALTGEVGANSAWVITDEALNILGLPASPPFDLEGAGEGVCLIWHLSFEDGLTGAEVGANAADLAGCYDLSNPITVIRNGVNGGEISTTDATEIIAGDGIADPIDVTLVDEVGTNSAWVITDASLNILGLPAAPPFDLEGAGEGVCLIWHLSFEDGLTGAEVGLNAADLAGCYDLSNSITVTRTAPAITDEDGDGVPADEDCDDNDASIPTTPGTSCDDGDAATTNDVILADGCGCAGEIIPTGGCDDIIIAEAAGVITTSGYSDPIVFVKIFNSTWSEVVFDSGMITDNSPQTITGLGEGTYHVYVKTYDSSWSQICDESLTVTISGAPGLPGISIGDVTVNEEDLSATLEICLTNISDEDVTVDYVTQEVLALEGSDYTAISGTATILAGELCTSVEVEILDDDFSEETETFSVDLGNASGAVITNAKGIVTILDTDGAPTGGCNDITITESGGVITTSGYNYPIVFVKVYDMSWNAVYDSGMITDNSDQVITGLAEGSYNVYVKTYDSSWTELCDESALITISGAPALPGIFINDVTVQESDALATLEICIDQVSSEDVTVSYTTNDATAILGEDFTASTGVAVIPAGETCVSISIGIQDDSIEEPTEVLNVDLSAPQNGVILDDRGVVTILDDDATNPVPSIYITDVTVNEEDGSALVDVCITFAAAEAVSVDYATTDGSAFAGEDYGTVTGTASIAAGELCTQILVPIADNAIEEPTEVLYIDLSAAVNATIGDDQGEVTILDTDQPSTGGCDAIVITENGGVISTSGYDYPIVFVKVYDMSWSLVFDSGMLSNNEPQTITGLPEGTYNVYVKTYNLSWAEQCNEQAQIIISEPSSNPCDDFGGDSDGDGVCDDNDICAGFDDNIDSDGDGIPDGCDNATTCVEREATNVISCSGPNEGLPYGGWLKIEGMNSRYDLVNSQLIEHEEGTATLTGSWVNQDIPECIFDFVIELSGRTTEAGIDGPKLHNCLDPNYDDFYYYSEFTGLLTGSNEMAGASISIESFGALFQLGVGANATGADLVFGASGWFSGELLTQPDNGLNLVLNPNADGHLGDININLSGGYEACLDVPAPAGDNSPCGTIVTTGNGSISIGGYSEPVAIIQIFNSQWNLMYSCMGDCVNPLTVDNLPAGDYLVKVNLYDANWSQACTEYAEYHTVSTGQGLEGQNGVEFLFFNAAKDDREVAVNWTTNTEYKNDYFVVERSSDGLNFEALYDVNSLKGEGDAAIYYQDNDARPNLGINYYRLKQVYEDGSYKYSQVKTVTFDVDLFDFTIYPNPTADMVFVNLKEYEGEAATIQLMNSIGEVIIDIRVDAITEEPIGFDVEKYAAGIYGMTIQVDGHKRLTRLFVKSKL